MQSLSYGNGKSLSQSFDLDYRLTRKTVTGVNDWLFGYDLTDNITGISDATDSSANQNFAFDAMSRLTSATGSYGDLAFTYDGVGNRLSKSLDGATDSYLYDTDSHHLQSVNGITPFSFTYDASGHTTSKGGFLYQYNQAGRLKGASVTGMNAEYRYNSAGQRVFKQVNGIKTLFIYDVAGQLIAEADAQGQILKEYIWLNGQRLAMIAGDNIYYVHTDHLGTPIALTDQSGQIQWQASYTPFGKATILINNIDNNLRFPGQYFDAESGLHYNYFRDYDPEIGRYIESDPIGLNGGINTYGYVGGNPVKYIDPLGLWSTAAHNYMLKRFGQLHGLSPQQINSLMRGSEFADMGGALVFQGAEFSYMHAMTSEAWPDKAKACKKANSYLKSKFSRYKGLHSGRIPTPNIDGSLGRTLRSTTYDPYFQLGMALHTVMDSTSPAHANFAYWDGDASTHGPGEVLGIKRNHTLESLEELLSNPDLLHTTLNKMDAFMDGAMLDCGCVE